MKNKELEEIIALNLFNVSINSGEIMSKDLDRIRNAVKEIEQLGYGKAEDFELDKEKIMNDEIERILEEFEMAVDSSKTVKCDVIDGELTSKYKEALNKATIHLFSILSEAKIVRKDTKTQRILV